MSSPLKSDPIQTLTQLEELTLCADLVMKVPLSLERQPQPFCPNSRVQLRVRDVVTLENIPGSAVIVALEVLSVFYRSLTKPHTTGKGNSEKFNRRGRSSSVGGEGKRRLLCDGWKTGILQCYPDIFSLVQSR